ncbi:MAG: DUF3575 domain-containing protein [Bacteroidota bacterium]
MKDLKTSILVLALVAACPNVFAQKTAGDFVVTAGTSIGIGVTTPSINASLDYAIKNKFSLGAGVTHTQLDRFSSIYSGSVYSGNLSRTNIGVRALYHFVERPNWDMYTGLRLGASIWAGSGTYDHLIFSTSNGSVIPTLQGLFGIRYMVQDWLGLNAEIGIGAPYAISVGVSCNLTNTRNAIAKISEAYNREIMPADKKNIIKINVGTMFLNPGLSYERYLKNRFSLEVGGSYKPNVQTIESNSYSSTNTFTETDSIRHGMKAYGLLKYYITARRNAFPKGLYLGLSYHYMNQTQLRHVEDNAVIKNPISFDYERVAEQHSGGLVIGYQQLLGKRFCLDAFMGPQFGNATLKSVKYFDPQANEEKFQAYFGEHQLSQGPGFKSFMFKMNIGYRF